jgi:hypothetical protein
MWMSCAKCGTLLPAEARFCLTCGAPQTSDAGTSAEDEARAEEDEPDREGAPHDGVLCEIGVWRGYIKAEFIATVRDGDSAWEVARSPAFRCRGREVPREDDPRAVAAFDRLLELLAADGWEPVGGGQPWYAYRFRRRFDASPLAGALRPYTLRVERPEAEDPVR